MLDTQLFDYYEEKDLQEGQTRRQKLKPHQYTVYPFNLIGIVEALHYNSSIHATGFLLSSCLVVTSAHSFCFIQQRNFKQIIPKAFYIGVIGHLDEHKICKVVDYRICPKYQDCVRKIQKLKQMQAKIKYSKESEQRKNSQREKVQKQCYRIKKVSEKYDYALLKIQKLVQRQSYSRIAVFKRVNNQIVTVCGYSRSGTDFHLHQHSNLIQVTPTGTMYDIDTAAGQSGSPLLLQNSGGIIVGLHKGYDPVQKLNTGTVFSQQTIQQLCEWSKQMNLNSVFFSPYDSQKSYISKSSVAEYKIDDEEVDKLKEMNTWLSEEMQDYKQEIVSLKESNTRLTKQLEYQRQQLEDYRLQKDYYISGLQNTKKRQQRQISQLNKQLKDAKSQLSKAQRLAENLKEQLRLQRHKNKSTIIEQKHRAQSRQKRNMSMSGNYNPEKLQTYLSTSYNQMYKPTIRKIEYLENNEIYTSKIQAFQSAHSKLFSIEETNTISSVTKIGFDNRTYSFIKKGEIGKGKITIIMLKQLTSKNSCIRYGVATLKILGVVSGFTHHDAITYDACDGQVCKLGGYHEKGRKIVDGQLVSIVVNRVQNRIEWHDKAAKLAETSITEDLKNKELFLVIMMRDNDDKVQFF